MKKILYILLFSIYFINKNQAQLTISAGPQKKVCFNTSTTLGGSPTATGGVPPYTYLWQPSTFLNSNSVSNPTAIGCNAYVLYTLRVIDGNNDTAYSYVDITINPIYSFNAGIDTGYCVGQEVGITIGASVNNNTAHTFSWSPTAGLNNPNSPNPIATPSITTIYTLTVSDGICPDNVSTITVNAFLAPIVYAGQDTTVNEGNSITLNGTGGTKFWWLPNYNIKYTNTFNPDVWPTANTTYTLFSENQHGCIASDAVVVNVIKGDSLFFYSAFTPNNDGENDLFYIGNLEKYPDNVLKIYNRYDKLIFSANGYENNWDGKYLGEEMPTGTYFYTLDNGKGKKYKGTVTILR